MEDNLIVNLRVKLRSLDFILYLTENQGRIVTRKIMCDILGRFISWLLAEQNRNSGRFLAAEAPTRG